MRRQHFVRTIVAIALAAAVLPAGAQTRATTADLSGVVLDESRAVLPGATVRALNVATNLERSTVTGGDGRYALPALPPGTYRVSAELPGFARQVHEQVTLSLGTSVDLDFVLPVGGAEETITVLAEAPLVDVQKTAVSNIVSQQQIESLPIDGRNFISFSIITPGVTTDRTPQQGASATSGLSFAGQRARSNNITVDGLDNNDSTVGSVRAVFSQEAVREFQVLTSSFSAEFGKASGGVVNIVTKSGTNTTAGTAFFYGRDDALNARAHFEKFNPAGEAIDRGKAPFRQQQFGGVLGGPVKRDRSFYFVSFERLSIDTNNFVTIDDRTPVLHPFLGTPMGTPAGILRSAGFEIETGNVPYEVKSSQFLAKLDHQLSPEQHLTVRYNWADLTNENIEPWGGLVARSRGAVLDSRDHMLAVSHTAVISSRAVNELRVQFARRDQRVHSLDPRCGGPCIGEDQGGPTVEVLVGPGASVGRHRFTPQPRANDRFQVLETISYYAGGHQLKAGLDFNYIDHRRQALPLHFGGRYLFAALPPIPGLLPGPVPTGIQALALGIPARYIQGYGVSSAPYGYSDVSLFVQDDWRVRPNLTLKGGLRYQRQFWPDIDYDVPGIGAYSFPSDANNVAPRVAAAWDPWNDRKTSVHASYGLFFDNHITAIAGITDIVDGTANGTRTLVASIPTTLFAWNAPGRRLPEPTTPYPSLIISIDPGLETPYAHHGSVGIDRQLPGDLAAAASFVYVRGFNQLGTIDYNPIVPALGAGRRPEDVNGMAGTSASILQYTSFGETWYRGLTLSLTKRFSRGYQLLGSYTLSRAEDNSTDFQSVFVPQDNGRGRNPADLTGLPIGFSPDAERGPATHDQRHRIVLSGLYVAPRDLHLSAIVTVASGRPYTILAGADLNGDGDGGTIPGPDRARGNLVDPASSLGRNSGTMPAQATVDVRVMRRFRLAGRTGIDGLVEVFNLLNRTNYTEINNIFGTGAYPTNPSPTFGQFNQAGPPLQVQLAVRLNF
jgi:hypothetical protein